MRVNERDVKQTGLILGIESSCDETAAAVVRAGGDALSNIVASQMNLHANYGGVVPELASREHLRNVVPVVRAAMKQAQVSFDDLDAIAVTEGPGLAGALLVGITYAKALSFGLGKPLIGVNHLEGHIHAVLMEARQSGAASMELPLLALVVSGGHTHLYLANVGEEGAWSYRNVGRTVDDAAGEAYDKVAKLLGLGYPGGPWIDSLAKKGNPDAVAFRFSRIKPRGHREGGPADEVRFDFSFSGIKTAVLRYIETHGMREHVEARRRELAQHPEWGPRSEEAALLCDSETLNLIASFQHAVVGNLLRQTFAAAETFGARGIVVSGGVAANSELRRRFQAEADRRGLPIAFPSVALSTDNAAMIAAAAWPKFVTGKFAPDTLGATPQLRLG
ncbi:tRNA (adenosine(37)-N6)-threonylcarbamoyltransferase complex transferase subunit TsaD [Edaphobacter sp. 12200R-103]|uniref:tRNA (adenosine(37)-N6)-threonylcarbamoyltransferase complex transferase subunit TsaD n=1 Tax=Edaphobacter sp. 12200R-103 TaxID=2703788 RepID=UPI00138CA9BD|nr:tRNA (adenosine(37)-N6)-threonylcarbamoyltransferase complex transferase subunit TsaD [Edaphobacter sp. 12200R-103]QHS52015.1 tRNA (adenosine(37)-N6)-threonylcarbamoyltransferase complex transferase subunit TsaD [Edaphobacter sp. 12200R-103]